MLAFVSPGCTLAVTNMIFRLPILSCSSLWYDLLAVILIFGTGKPQIVVHNKLLSYTTDWLMIDLLKAFLGHAFYS